MTLLGWTSLIVGSIAFAGAAQWLIRAERLHYRWVATAIATFVGAYVASDALLPGDTAVFEGVAVVPAIAGGLAVGLVVDLLIHYLAGPHTGAVDSLE